MTNQQGTGRVFRIVLLGVCSVLPVTVRGQNTVYFSTSDAGQMKSISDWGVDTAWPSADNMRLSMAHMGVDQIDVVRLNFYVDEPLEANGEIGPNSKARLDTQLSIAAMAGNKPLALTPNSADAPASRSQPSECFLVKR